MPGYPRPPMPDVGELLTPDEEPLTPEEQRAKSVTAYAARVEDRTNMTPEEKTNAILAEWKDAGIDTDDPLVQVIAGSTTTLDAWTANKVLFDAVTQDTLTRFSSRATSAYYQTLEQSNLAEYQFPEPEPTAAGAQLVRHKPGLEPSELPSELVEGGANYYVDPNTGAVLYRNGVVVDQTGQVFYPPSGNIAGSSAWRNKGRESWSEEKVAKWKGRLVELGYLPKEAAKSAAWDTSFDSALQNYFNSKYQNFGKPLEFDEAAGGYGPGGSTFSNLANIRATIETGITEQYQRLFGVDPTEGELKDWARFVIRTGNELQRGPHGISSGTAAVEAQAEARQRLEDSPGARFLQESQQENTRMRDALEQAVIVTNSLAS